MKSQVGYSINYPDKILEFWSLEIKPITTTKT